MGLVKIHKNIIKFPSPRIIPKVIPKKINYPQTNILQTNPNEWHISNPSQPQKIRASLRPAKPRKIQSSLTVISTIIVPITFKKKTKMLINVITHKKWIRLWNILINIVWENFTVAYSSRSVDFEIWKNIYEI